MLSTDAAQWYHQGGWLGVDKRAVSGHEKFFHYKLHQVKKGHVFLIGNCKECWFLLLNSCAEQMGFKPNGYSGSTVNNSDGSILVQTSEFTFNWKGLFLGTLRDCNSSSGTVRHGSGHGRGVFFYGRRHRFQRCNVFPRHRVEVVSRCDRINTPEADFTLLVERKKEKKCV